MPCGRYPLPDDVARGRERGARARRRGDSRSGRLAEPAEHARAGAAGGTPCPGRRPEPISASTMSSTIRRLAHVAIGIDVFEGQIAVIVEEVLEEERPDRARIAIDLRTRVGKNSVKNWSSISRQPSGNRMPFSSRNDRRRQFRGPKAAVGKRGASRPAWCARPIARTARCERGIEALGELRDDDVGGVRSGNGGGSGGVRRGPAHRRRRGAGCSRQRAASMPMFRGRLRLPTGRYG